MVPYIVVQVLGAIAVAAVLWVIASIGFSDLSPAHYSEMARFITEALATFFFLFIIIGTTSKGRPRASPAFSIGPVLTLIYLVTIPVTNTSVNPARSTGPALFAGGAYVGQLWLFWAAPILGR